MTPQDIATLIDTLKELTEHMEKVAESLDILSRCVGTTRNGTSYLLVDTLNDQ